MALTNADIRSALQQRLATVANLPNVVWTDYAHDPLDVTPYILATFLAQSKKPIDNLFVLARGVLQLDVRYPLGMNDDAEAMAASIEATFPATGVLQVTLSDGMTQIDYSQAQNGVHDGSFWKVPVLIGWHIYQSV